MWHACVMTMQNLVQKNRLFFVCLLGCLVGWLVGWLVWFFVFFRFLLLRINLIKNIILCSLLIFYVSFKLSGLRTHHNSAVRFSYTTQYNVTCGSVSKSRSYRNCSERPEGFSSVHVVATDTTVIFLAYNTIRYVTYIVSLWRPWKIFIHYQVPASSQRLLKEISTVICWRKGTDLEPILLWHPELEDGMYSNNPKQK